jgi:hypothetical protein
LRENHFSFADDHCIRDAGSEKKGMLQGDFGASDNDLYAIEVLPDPCQEVKGALNVPQTEGAADDIRLPVEDLLQKMPVIEFLFFRCQPSRGVLGGETRALHSVGQVKGGNGQIFSCCCVVLKSWQLEEEELLRRFPVWHKVSLYHRSGGRTNAAHGLSG